MAPLPSPLRARVRPAGRRAPRPDAAEAAERALLLRLVSLLLQYPDRELLGSRPELTAAVAALPPSPAADELAAFAAWFAAAEPDDAAQHYVEVFDLRRRSSLYLTYYLHGDTRRRGMALLALAQRFRAAGWEPAAGELPDHLPLVLEYAALAGPRGGEAPLRLHRRGLELIRHALADTGSPYRHVLTALTGLLPPPTAEDLAAVAELAAAGPPAEEVGLSPYGAADDVPPYPQAPPYPDLPPYAEAPGAAGSYAPPGTFVPPPPAPRGGAVPRGAAPVRPAPPAGAGPSTPEIRR